MTDRLREPKNVIVIRTAKVILLTVHYTAKNLEHARVYAKCVNARVEVHKLAASFRHNP